MGIQTSKQGYIKVLNYLHFGEHAFPTGKVKDDKAEFRLLRCKHGDTFIWLKRSEIGVV